MALSKSTRILILLTIDSAFFLLELITGYAVHSLALVADSFHMLNDVLSLLVGLWAVKKATQTTHPKMYTYGYQRAETLGALVNGVFLVALCVTIFLDAIARFVEPQEVSNPQIVLIVGCLGLLSNLVGLALFHDHSHSHGGGGHDHAHSHANEARDAEEGHAGHAHEHYTDEAPHMGHDDAADEHAETVRSDATVVADDSRPKSRSTHRHSRTASRPSEDFQGPAHFRNSLIQRARDDEADEIAARAEPFQPLLGGTGAKIAYDTLPQRPASVDHKSHKHAQPRESGKGGHGHSHGDLNMKGIFLHVMGDALGNIGVIATALIIWLTDFEGRFYFDPAISLVITVIILCSAIPLCKAASHILLQAVPHGIEIDDIQYDIEQLPGVDSCHHLHVWTLSDTKLIASLHVRVNFNFKKGEGSQRYMELANEINKCLHEYGIHSSTIQPEFHPDQSDVEELSPIPGGSNSYNGGSRQGSVRGDQSCLLDCDDNCGGDKSCCPPAPGKDDRAGDGHDHSH